MEISGAIRQNTSLPEHAQLSRPPSLGSRSPHVELQSTRPSEEPAGSATTGVSPKIAEALSESVAAKVRGGSRVRIDEATDRVVVQILDANNEVIKQIPPDELLRALARFRQVTGILFDRQV